MGMGQMLTRKPNTNHAQTGCECGSSESPNTNPLLEAGSYFNK